MKRDTADLVCPYCDEVPEPLMSEADPPYKGEWHYCKFVNAMVRFIPASHKRENPDRPRKRPELPIRNKNRTTGEPYASGSYIIPLGTDDPSPVYGRPTRGRR